MIRSIWPVALAGLVVTGCSDTTEGFDIDLRDNLGDAFDTTPAVEQAVAARPSPDNRGVISYPTYQVAVARRGDTVQTIAARVGLPARELASYNGVPENQALRPGEVIALPRRVSEPSPATGAPVAGPIRVAEPVATTSLEDRAQAAINGAPVQPVKAREPVRHQVQAGETAFSIARKYNVPVRALAEWNSLDSNMTVRRGSYLLIPVAAPVANRTTQPGQGTVAPVPPSAAAPLPAENATQAPPKDTPKPANLAQNTTSASASGSRLIYPVQGDVVRAYSKGKNDGIDIAAPAGAAVKAAASGTVAAITRDTDQVPILVLRHAGNLLTVYAGVEGITVSKGDTVKRGQTIAKVRRQSPSVVHFEVREGFESADPSKYLD
ncbi:M23 family metallopeptidase [Palleronia caenipelagi]|uniref:M23 family metallopeptidase n=1 Tax=Palleronia caenipelagi TaxID=2489174 RepID=A0A547Q9E8_9RHOB|nr:M23 family metallopeptidase [Palleronia caenipelagi]TRD23025.1 M23 family metallopeptidase [Palleronia caenipelagi]